jgi:hypothetical protein
MKLKMFVLCNSLGFPRNWQVIECLNDEKGHIKFEAILDFHNFNKMINALLFLLFSYGAVIFRSVLVLVLLIFEHLNLCIRFVSMVWHCSDFHVVPLLQYVSQSLDYHVVIPLSSWFPWYSRVSMVFMVTWCCPHEIVFF